MKKLATNSWSAREALARREPFTTYGAFRAVRGFLLPYGNWLPPRWREKYRADREEIMYTVLSYQTPIAWVRSSGEIIIPDVKYSLTTSGHQGLLYALSQPADGPLAIAAQNERQAARERAARRRRAAVTGGSRVPVRVAAAGSAVRDRSGTPEGSPDVLARIDDVVSRPVPANSGEAAIYSVEYLERTTGPRNWAEAA